VLCEQVPTLEYVADGRRVKVNSDPHSGGPYPLLSRLISVLLSKSTSYS
jgi:hypothetical protein